MQVRDSGSAATVALAARLARRGAARPIVMLEQHGSQRVATVTAAGLWRWAFRGGAAEEAYRRAGAAMGDWLLGDEGRGTRERVVPGTHEGPNGRPTGRRWSSPDSAHALAVTL